MRYTITTRVNIENAPYDADDTAAELTDSILHWTEQAYGRTDAAFGHNAVTVDSVKHAETAPMDEARDALRKVYDEITASEQRRTTALVESAADAEERADYYDHDSLSADMNQERGEDLDCLREAVRVLLGVLA